MAPRLNIVHHSSGFGHKIRRLRKIELKLDCALVDGEKYPEGMQWKNIRQERLRLVSRRREIVAGAQVQGRQVLHAMAKSGAANGVRRSSHGVTIHLVVEVTSHAEVERITVPNWYRVRILCSSQLHLMEKVRIAAAVEAREGRFFYDVHTHWM